MENHIYIHKNKIYFSTKDGLFDLDRISLMPILNNSGEKVNNVYDFNGNNITNDIQSNTLSHIKKEILDRGVGQLLTDEEFETYSTIY